MEMEDPRKAGKLKEKALKESEKLKKNFLETSIFRKCFGICFKIKFVMKSASTF